MSLRADYDRDYHEFGGSFEEYREMVWMGRIFLAVMCVVVGAIIWILVM